MSDARDHLRRLIALKGPLSLTEYMTEALWHPSAGYYATSAVLGAAGDYVTSPEISQMFGELIGLWCAASWETMGRPAPVRLVELGPGRGTLMADALRASRRMPGFLDAIDIHLVEASSGLREQQRAALHDYDVTWHTQFGLVPDGPLLLVANEFLDALPVLQLERVEAGWRERLVDYDTETARFRFVRAARPTPAERLIPEGLRGAPVGSVVEISPAALSLVATIAQRLAAQGGRALFIDYGPAESSIGVTLQALHRHRRHDPLEMPGSADLTAHVDFAALAQAARAAGAVPCGPITQGRFLTRLGIAQRTEHLAGASPARAGEIAAALRRLIAPEEMGTLFKALALSHPALPTPAGFEPPKLCANGTEETR